MKSTLADALELVLPDLSPEIVSPDSLSRLKQLAQWSAPIYRAGFECRLSENGSQVDLQQGIFAQDQEPAVLAEHIAALATLRQASYTPVWHRLNQFCQDWRDPTTLFHQGITEVWLEFDLDGSIAQTMIPLPSIFIALDQQIARTPMGITITETALEMLSGQQISEPLRSNLHRCFASCPSPAYIKYIGLMLSRPLEAVRVNVGWLPPEQVSSYLQAIKWSGAAADIERLTVQLLDVVDQVRICLDLSQDIVHPQIGLECFFAQQSGLDSRWLPLLGDLVAQGLCTPEKRDALLTWVGYVTPNSSSGCWPVPLIAQSLFQPSDRLSVFERGLSHIKLIHRPQQELEVKAYFGFMHRWLSPTSADGSEQNQDSVSVAPVDPSSIASSTVSSTEPIKNQFKNQLDHSIALATRFLLSARNQGGWWRDFNIRLRGNRGDEWVTAYIATTLASLTDQPANQAAQHAWTLLCKRRQMLGGWGYNAWLPPDADSTVWGLRLASAIGKLESERAQQAIRFLDRYFQLNGGLASYVEDLVPRDYAGSASVQGWCDVHTCVTAAAAGVTPIQAAPLRFLRDTQRPNGSWKSFWWYDDEYATALAAEALANAGAVEDHQRVQQAIDWTTGRIQPSGAVRSKAYDRDSAFATAWSVRLLSLDRNAETNRALQRAIDWLIANQKPDGSWSSSAMLCCFGPEIKETDAHPGFSYIFPDDRRLFTTATVLAAFSSVQQRF